MEPVMAGRMWWTLEPYHGMIYLAPEAAAAYDADGAFTPAGAELRQRIEDRTDALALAPWGALGHDGCDELRTLVRPMSKTIVEGGTFGARHPR